MRNFIYYALIFLAFFAFCFALIGFLDLSQGYEVHYRENVFLAFILGLLSTIAFKIAEK